MVPPTHGDIRFLTHIRPLIAPLWADFNFRDSGTVYYNVIYESDQEALNNVLQVIKHELAHANGQTISYDSFNPNVAVIITWFRGSTLEDTFTVSASVHR